MSQGHDGEHCLHVGEAPENDGDGDMDDDADHGHVVLNERDHCDFGHRIANGC